MFGITLFPYQGKSTRLSQSPAPRARCRRSMQCGDRVGILQGTAGRTMQAFFCSEEHLQAWRRGSSPGARGVPIGP